MGSSKSRFIVLLAVLAVIVIIALLVANPFKTSRITEEDPAEVQASLFCDFTIEDITRFDITQPDKDTFSLMLEDGEWLAVNGENRYRADQGKIDRLLEDVPGLRSQGLATNKADKHGKFEITDDKGFQLGVYTGGDSPAVLLMVGASAGPGSSFVRRVGEDQVYRSSKNVKSLIGFSFNDYRTKKPWAYEPGDAREVTVRRPRSADEDEVPAEREARTFTLVDGFWKSEDGSNANQNLLTKLINDLPKLNISTFVEDEPTMAESGTEGLEPDLTVTVKDQVFSLAIGNDLEGHVYAKDQDGVVYRLSTAGLKFYNELAFDELTFDDTITEPEEPAEGVEADLPSDITEDQ